MQTIKTIFFVSLIIWSYYLIYALYLGLIVNPIPELGDGWDYHIPIAQTILDGRFLHPSNYRLPQWYFPGSGQLINSIFLLLHIPITISNVVAVILLFIICVKLALTFRLKYYFALLFGTTIVTVNAISRWYNDMSLDVLLAFFFIWAVILLERPVKSYRYFVTLGFIFGMLIGSKYSALFFVLVLILLYGRKLLGYVNISRFIIFFIPFSIFGLFWYIRNYIYMHNPVYPIPILGLPNVDIYKVSILDATIKYPFVSLNAFYSEYNIWAIIMLAVFGFYIFKKITTRLNIFGVNRLYILGISCAIFYLFNPTSYQPWIMVSSFRYSYPACIPLILCIFILAAHYKKETLLGFVSIGSMIMVLSMAYYPKLTPIYLAVAFILNFIFEKNEKRLTGRQR